VILEFLLRGFCGRKTAIALSSTKRGLFLDPTGTVETREPGQETLARLGGLSDFNNNFFTTGGNNFYVFDGSGPAPNGGGTRRLLKKGTGNTFWRTSAKLPFSTVAVCSQAWSGN